MTPQFRSTRTWDWVHPSFRDLVIDQLANDESNALQYLRTAGISAIALALSEGGGARGDRSFPLLKSTTSWLALQSSIDGVIDQDPVQGADSIMTLLLGVKNAPKSQWVKLVDSTCISIRDKWHRSRVPLTSHLIEKFLTISSKASSYIPAPSLEASLLEGMRVLSRSVEVALETNDTDDFNLFNWFRLVKTIDETEPKLLKYHKVKEFAKPLVERLLDLFENEAEFDETPGSPDECDELIEKLEILCSEAEEIAKNYPQFQPKIDQIMNKLDKRRDSLVNEVNEMRASMEDTEDGWQESYRAKSNFDIEHIFRDL